MSVEKLERILESLMTQSSGDITYDSVVLKMLRPVSGENGHVICEMKVEDIHCNTHGTLHGGVIATLIDVVSTIAVMTTGKGNVGVSVGINIAYMKAANKGDDLIIKGKSLRTGRTLAFLTADIRNKSGGSLVAQGTQTKFMGGSL